MIRRPPRSTQGVSSAASDVYKRQGADVPKAITVDPIRKGDTPYLDADRTEYFSSFCALIQIKAIPEKINIKVRVVI